MSALVKRLEKVDKLCATVDECLARNKNSFMEFERNKLREARQELQETTKQIHESQQAAIELLTRMRDVTICGALYPDEISEITAVIGLLDGSLAMKEAEYEQRHPVA